MERREREEREREEGERERERFPLPPCLSDLTWVCRLRCVRGTNNILYFFVCHFVLCPSGYTVMSMLFKEYCRSLKYDCLHVFLPICHCFFILFTVYRANLHQIFERVFLLMDDLKKDI